MWKRILPPLLPLLVAAAMSGCGGDGNDNGADTARGAFALDVSGYEGDVVPLGEQIVGQLGDKLGRSGFGEQEVTDVINAQGADVAEFVDFLEEIIPPAILLTEHQRLLEAMRAIEGALAIAASASEEGDSDAVDEALDVVSSNLRTTETVLDEIDAEVARP
jgi:hypothetical protein